MMNRPTNPFEAARIGRMTRRESGGSPYSPPGRTTVSFTTGTLAAGASENGNVTISPAYQLYTAAANYPSWVRLYTDSASRSSDSSRIPADDPDEGAGCMLEMIFISTFLTAILSPMVNGYTTDGTSTVPYRVTNDDSVSRAITVTFTFIETEA